MTTIQERTEQQPVQVPVRQSRAAARSRDLSDLMQRRPDLAGVYPPADVATEAVRWSA